MYPTLFLYRIILFCTGVSLLFGLAQAQEGSPAAFDPALRQKIAGEGKGSYIVLLQEQADLNPAYTIADWRTRGRFVIGALRSVAARTQPPVYELLARQQRAGDAKTFYPLTIVNGFLVTSGVATFDLLTRQGQVAHLEIDSPLPAPETTLRTVGVSGQSAVEWGVARIGADAIWRDFGVTGEGVVVANIDSGVDYLHPALLHNYRGNLGDGRYDHAYSWFDPFLPEVYAPAGADFHGTHTMGTLAGADGPDGPIGVAPGAQWIAATGSTSTGAGLLSAQWMLAPYPLTGSPADGDPDRRPHVISNSWNFFQGGDYTYARVIAAWRAAGIVPVFSAGNFGYSPGTISSPADDCNVLAVGATDNRDQIAYFSGQGPGKIAGCPDKPDFSAPGVAVRSAMPGGYATADGTSMAAPHLAGCVALLLSLRPELSYGQLYALLQESAVDLGAPGYDPRYGYGRIDCYAAAAAATFLRLTPTRLDLCIHTPPPPLTVRVVEPGDQPPPVALSAVEHPPGAGVQWGANPLTPTVGALVTTTLTLALDPATPAGRYPLTIVGEAAAGRVHTGTVDVGIFAGPPPAPRPGSPAEGAVNVGRQPLLAWEGDDATSYRLEVATDGAFGSLVYSRTVTATSHRLEVALGFDSTYFWRVTPVNPCGEGPASSPRAFVAETPILHVDHSAQGAGNGAAWADSFPSLGAALAVAQAGSEIWVAAGRYSPGPQPEDSFLLADGVRVYGGFAGGESQREQRNPDLASNRTILDGGGRSNHVVSGFYLGPATVLDGFVITGGNAVTPTITGEAAGGGIYLVHSSLQLRHLAIVGNHSSGSGGGIRIVNGSPRLEWVTLAENSAFDGGGMHCYCPGAVLRDVEVVRNRAENLGGGLVVWGESVTIVNGLIAGNRAYLGGGGLISNASVANLLVVGNQATTYGGGLWSVSASPQFSQITLAGNRAGKGGGAIYHNAYSYLPPYRLANAIFWQNSGAQFMIEGRGGVLIDGALLAGGCPTGATCSGALLTANPRLMRNPSWGADGVWGTGDDDYGDLRLQAGSPAVDAGTNGAVSADLLDLDADGDRAEPLPFDVAGAARFVDMPAADTGFGSPPLVDLGAYEAWAAPTPTPTVTPTTTATATATASATPTATASATPTPTPTATASATPTATFTPTATPIAGEHSYYLPFLQSP